MKMEQTQCSETSAYKIQTPGNYPEENTQHTEHGESLKSRMFQPIHTHFTFTFLHYIIIHRMGTLQETNSFLFFIVYYMYNAAKQIVVSD